uniref:Uncharacterized protein n=1 Tax=Arundo donax TaxID=35708 RepID=A0A0A9A5E3_ARUDO
MCHNKKLPFQKKKKLPTNSLNERYCIPCLFNLTEPRHAVTVRTVEWLNFDGHPYPSVTNLRGTVDRRPLNHVRAHLCVQNPLSFIK